MEVEDRRGGFRDCAGWDELVNPRGRVCMLSADSSSEGPHAGPLRSTGLLASGLNIILASLGGAFPLPFRIDGESAGDPMACSARGKPALRGEDAAV
jgi:hypothetical protein